MHLLMQFGGVVAPDVVAKLIECGIQSVEEVLSSSVPELRRRTGLATTVLADTQSAIGIVLAGTTSDAWTLLCEWRRKPNFVVTGLGWLNELLGGGLARGEITELFGGPGSGKTQLVLAILSSFPAAIVYDTQHSFSPLRVLDAAAALGGDQDKDALEALRVVRVHNVFDLLDSLQLLEEALDGAEVSPSIGMLSLLVVDSWSALVGPILGRQTRGHYLMVRTVQLLQKLAEASRLAVLVTNSTVAEWNTGGSGSGRTGVKPALGGTWSAVPHTRILLSREASSRQANSREICTLQVVRSAFGRPSRTIRCEIPASVGAGL